MVSNKNSNGQVTTENGHFYFHFHFIQQIYSFEILDLISFSSLLYKPYASLKRLKFLKNMFEITDVKNVDKRKVSLYTVSSKSKFCYVVVPLCLLVLTQKKATENSTSPLHLHNRYPVPMVADYYLYNQLCICRSLKGNNFVAFMLLYFFVLFISFCCDFLL